MTPLLTPPAAVRLTRLLGWFHRAPGQPRLTAATPLGWRRVLPVGLVGLMIAAVVVGARIGLPDEVDATAPFTVGTHWGLAEELAAAGAPVTAEARYGYDGQWFLAMAYDPSLRNEIVPTFDRPQYRAQRPLYSVAGWLLAGGQPRAAPYALLAVSMLVVALGCAACARVVTAYGRSRWWGLLFAAVPGVVVGVAYGTAEPMALALSALGLCLVLDRRYGWAGAAFAAAALTKETYLAFGAVAAVFLVVDALGQWGGSGPGRGAGRGAGRPLADRGRDWRATGRAAGLVVLPGAAALALWWWYVSATVPDSQRTPNHLLDLPFAGWWRTFTTITSGEYPSYQVLGPVLLAVTFGLLVAGMVLALRRRQSLLAYGVFLWSGFGLALVSIMLERFLSAQRVLAPCVLVAALFLVTAWKPARARVSPSGSGQSDQPAVPSSQ